MNQKKTPLTGEFFRLEDLQLFGPGSSSFLVLPVGYQFKVLRVATQSVVAKMIYLFLTR